MKIFLLHFIGIVSYVILIVYYERKIKRIKSIASNMDNNVIRDILDLSAGKTVKSSAEAIIRALKNYYRLDYCTVLVKNEGLHYIASNVEEMHLKNVEENCNKILSNMNGQFKGKITSSNSFLEYASASERGIKYSYFIPLKQNNLIGAIYIENKEDYKDNQFELEFFKVVVKNITIALQNCIYQDEIKSMAMRDNLTKLYNRNYMFLDIKNKLKPNKQLVLGMLDIDNFKKCNDTYGHDFGDLVLIEVSHFIKENIRDSDEIYRWGGEEFIISFDDTACKEVFKRLDSIRDKLSRHQISDKKVSINITVSFGIAEYPMDASNIDDLINCADKALYHSKETGKNKVTIYSTLK